MIFLVSVISFGIPYCLGLWWIDYQDRKYYREQEKEREKVLAKRLIELKSAIDTYDYSFLNKWNSYASWRALL